MTHSSMHAASSDAECHGCAFRGHVRVIKHRVTLSTGPHSGLHAYEATRCHGMKECAILFNLFCVLCFHVPRSALNCLRALEMRLYVGSLTIQRQVIRTRIPWR